ncbi:MAG: hemerythrin domain-containing protein [Alistipes sp.]|nr:hemerythrin domain-containing protein [Alistipes sp.]
MQSERYEGLFVGDMKLGDLIDANYKLLTILSRLGIRLGFGEVTVEEMCRRYGLSPQLFLIICRIYTFDGYTPSCESLGDEDLRRVVSYLRASHRYYKEYSLPRLRKGVGETVASCDELHRKVLEKFFDDYCGEVASHFAYEEDVVFPYIDSLLDGCVTGDFRIGKFEDNHSDVDEKLNDMKSIIIKYLPEACPTEQRDDMLFGICRFEEDLARHTLIEERVLIPLVTKIEKRL